MISTTPFPYQDKGADFLAGRRRALLFDAPGLGKTLQALLAAERAGVTHHDVICPAAVVSQWRGHAVEANYGFQSVSYNFARDKGLPRKMQALTLDELHLLKNPSSGRTRAILGFDVYGTNGAINNAEYVWGLTGTPSPRDPSDLFPAMKAIVPGSLRLGNGKIMGYEQFLKKFCVLVDTGRGMVIKGGQNLPELRDRLAPYMLRRTKKEVMPEWKEPVTAPLWLEAGKGADDLIKLEAQPEAHAVASAFRLGGFDGLAELARTDQTGVSRYRRYCGMLKIAPISEWLVSELHDPETKMVVIAYHREVIEGIHAKLAESGIGAVVYYGGMNEKEKDAVKATFVTQPKARVFIGQLTASGTGLDGLQHATGRMVFAEYSWIADDNYQAICRLDRIGQQEPVLGQFAGFEGSLDGAIMKSAARRAKENKQLFG